MVTLKIHYHTKNKDYLDPVMAKLKKFDEYKSGKFQILPIPDDRVTMGQVNVIYENGSTTVKDSYRFMDNMSMF